MRIAGVVALVLAACVGRLSGPPQSLDDDAGAIDARSVSALDAAIDAIVDARPDATPDASPDAAPPARDVDVALFSNTGVYFLPSDNRRQRDAQVALPITSGGYRSITLRLALRCPPGDCDWWDRHGHLSIVKGNREIELLRFVTPYRKPMSVSLDVTDLAPLLAGDTAVRVFIDTWVGPGHANGAGWLVDASLAYRAGAPPRAVQAVIPLWSPQGVVYGDPGRPPSLSTTVEVPAGVRGARLWTVISGHGQGNADNCAEFCPRNHAVTVGAARVSRRIWRDDCASTAVPDQPGTWTLDRAGWCPGALVVPWIEDVAIGAGQSVPVRWSPDAYTNTCREGVPASDCRGCTLGTGCPYDGNAHTEPSYQVSGLLVLLR